MATEAAETLQRELRNTNAGRYPGVLRMVDEAIPRIEDEARSEWQERALTAESNLAWSEDRRADLAKRIEERVVGEFAPSYYSGWEDLKRHVLAIVREEAAR